MSHSQDHQDISKYLSGEMSVEEKKTFEDRLSKDPQLRQLFELEKDVDLAINNEEAIEFIDLVKQDLKKRLPMPIPSWWRTNKSYYGIAAMIALLVTIGLLLNYFVPEDPRNEKDLIALFKPNKIDFTFRSNDNLLQAEVSIQKGISLYNSSKYIESAQILKKVLSRFPSSIQIKYYYGLSVIYSGKLLEGKKIMEQVYNSKDLLYSKEALWQLVFCCIEQDSMSAARKGLVELKQDPYYNEKVEEVLEIIGYE
jgi:tetratricopeptide (TPR) repeat protein